MLEVAHGYVHAQPSTYAALAGLSLSVSLSLLSLSLCLSLCLSLSLSLSHFLCLTLYTCAANIRRGNAKQWILLSKFCATQFLLLPYEGKPSKAGAFEQPTEFAQSLRRGFWRTPKCVHPGDLGMFSFWLRGLRSVLLRWGLDGWGQH